MRKIAFDIPPSDSLAVTISHCLDTTDVIVQVYEKVEMIMILKHPQVEILDKDNVRITLRWTPGVWLIPKVLQHNSERRFPVVTFCLPTCVQASSGPTAPGRLLSLLGALSVLGA